MIKEFLYGGMISSVFYIFLVFFHAKWFKRSFIGDTSWHFLVVKSLKKNKKFDGIDELIMRDGPDTYPMFFHWLCSFFPLKILSERQYIPNFIISLIIYGSLYLYLGLIFDLLGSQNHLEKFCIFSLFLFSQPHQYVLKGDKILNIQLSERLMASLCAGLYYLALYFLLLTHDIFSFVFVIIFGSLCWVVSLFSRQAIFFSSIFLSLLLPSPIPIIMALLSYLIAMIFDFKYLNNGIVQQIEFLYTYCKFIKKGTFMKEVILEKGYPRLDEIRTKKTLGASLYAIYSRAPINFLYKNPDVTFLIIYIIYAGVRWNELVFFLVPLILYAMTASRTLHFIGEAERYVHYLSKFYNSFLFLILFEKTSRPVYALCIILLYSLINIISYARYNKKTKLPEKDILSDVLDKSTISKESTFFCIPHTLGSAVVVRKGCKALSNQGTRFPLAYLKTVMSDPPFLKHHWSQIFEDYSITHVLVDKSTDEKIKAHCNWSYDYGELNKLSEDAAYILYSVK